MQHLLMLNGSPYGLYPSKEAAEAVAEKIEATAKKEYEAVAVIEKQARANANGDRTKLVDEFRKVFVAITGKPFGGYQNSSRPAFYIEPIPETQPEYSWLRPSQIGTTPVFVYGTLRRGHGNESFLVAHDRIDAVTANPYSVTHGLPRLLKAPSAPVRGELYYVTDRTLSRLDSLEHNGVVYKRELIPVLLSTGESVAAWAYFYLAENKAAGKDGNVPVINGEVDWGLWNMAVIAHKERRDAQRAERHRERAAQKAPAEKVES